jgi:serine protease Do
MPDSNNNIQPNEDEFAFITEKIVKKPKSKWGIILRILMTVCLAVVFGVVASFIFAVTRPYMESHFGKAEKEPETIVLPEDEPEKIEEEEPESSTPVVTENIIEKSLEISDYQQLYAKLNQVAVQAKKSLVVVTGVMNKVDILDNPYENTGECTGVVLANNGVEMLIMTTYSTVSDADTIEVEFYTGETAAAALKSVDMSSDIAVIGIPLDSINPSTVESVPIAVLGNTYAVYQGNLVMALGSPLGSSDTMAYGIVSSTENSVQLMDANYEILTTDIVSASDGNGVLINLDGEVIGWINKKSVNTDSNLTTALSISNIKSVIERLLNGNNLVCCGLRGSDVTTDLVNKKGLPKGVYVSEVFLDSPAFAAGIQSGDIIISMNGEEIATMSDFQKELQTFYAGDEIVLGIMRKGVTDYVEIEVPVLLEEQQAYY